MEAIFFGGLHDFSCMWAPSVTEERPPGRLRSFKTCRSGKTGGDAANKHRPGQTEASSAALTTASSSESLLKLSFKKNVFLIILNFILDVSHGSICTYTSFSNFLFVVFLWF